MVTQRDSAGKAHWDDNSCGDQLSAAIDAGVCRGRGHAMRPLRRLCDEVLDECVLSVARTPTDAAT